MGESCKKRAAASSAKAGGEGGRIAEVRERECEGKIEGEYGKGIRENVRKKLRENVGKKWRENMGTKLRDNMVKTLRENMGKEYYSFPIFP